MGTEVSKEQSDQVLVDAKSEYIDEVLQQEDNNSDHESEEHVHELSELDKLAQTIDPKNYLDEYPFENLIFEGGGAKGIAYPGALRALEEVGIMTRIKRFAGTSVGSITATMAALGYKSTEIREVMSTDFSKYYESCIFMLKDARFGKFSIIPNLLWYLGWQPLHTLYDYIGEIVEKKLGDKDATFEQLYKELGKELCIVATNLNDMEETYFHPKTTPKMPLRKAVRMSISLPGIMQPIKHTDFGVESMYVDGGVLINYPIECYDGWWLSMKKEDSFFERLQPLEKLPFIMDRKNRFARDEAQSSKSLGFILYSEDEIESFKSTFESRRKTKLQFPDTPMGRKATQKTKDEKKLNKEHQCVRTSVSNFLKILQKNNLDKDEFINREELENTIKSEELTDCDKKRLFGKNVSVDEVMAKLDKDGNGKISYEELVSFIEETGISVVHRRLGFCRQQVNTLLSLLQTLYNTMSLNIVRISVSAADMSRTVGLNSHYIGTLTFDYTKEDADFVEQESHNTTMAFLKNFVAKLKIERKAKAPVISTKNAVDD
ncbi:uncharacterized protein LOC133178945 [Saccostrea echinata]|uniref:uncharacterized protein LOC133178945 n=1 Tax=Saccostrea echinata TaxID=191078 RepID=UPI002A80DD77|nr:uncharacterized protein LOC133178945 [Saccostrea echinata]